jgi:hypothetical protein
VPRLAIRIAVLSLGAAAAATAVRPAAAQLPSPTCARCLDGHRFLASSLVPDPFVATYFTSALGGGLAHNLTVPVRDVDGAEVGALSGDIGFMLLDFRYQYRAARWLALRAGVTAAGRVGTSSQALLASGMSAAYGASLGATVRVWGRSDFLVSLTGDYSANSDYLIDPYGFARGVATSGLTDSTRDLLIQNERLGRAVGGARVAWAPARWVGLNGMFEFGSAETLDGGWTSVSDYGAVADVDFRALSRVPLGLVLGARGQSGASGATTGGASAWTAGLHYTGREAFTIGLEAAWARQDLQSEDVARVTVNQVRLITRLDF